MSITEEDFKASNPGCHPKKGNKEYTTGQSPTANYFIIRATAKLMKYYEKTGGDGCGSRAVPKLMSCIKSAIDKVGMRDSQRKFSRRSRVSLAKETGTAFNSTKYVEEKCGHLKQDDEGHLKQVGTPLLDLVNGKFAPGCITHLTISLGKCSTCCCKEGLSTTDIAHKLVYGTHRKCGPFFGMADSLVRLMITAWRAGILLADYQRPCFSLRRK